METTKEKKVVRAFGAIDVVVEKTTVTLEWIANPINDMYADALIMAVLQAESMETPKYVPNTTKIEDRQLKECLVEMLQDMFGEDSVPKTIDGDSLEVRSIIWP